MSSNFIHDLHVHLEAGYPALLVRTAEYTRIEREIIEAKNGRLLFFWNAAEGLLHAGESEERVASEDPAEALAYALNEIEEPALVVLRDFHHYFADPQILAMIQAAISRFKQMGSAILFVSHGCELPGEIKHEIAEIRFSLPDAEMLRASLHGIYESGKAAYPDASLADEETVLRAAAGMNTMEAENAFSKSLVEHETFVADSIIEAKMAALEKGGMLRYYQKQESLDSVGGMDHLKDWLLKRKKAFSAKAREYGLRTPRGVLITGISGTGKSLCAKAMSAAWDLPLLHFDVGAVFGSLVGESEANIREVQERAEALAPVILWIDELEKAFAGMGAEGDHDSGTSKRVFGSFLTWLQEKQSEVFVVATSNDVTVLPPELLRKGRFDEMFFVDLPTTAERIEIARIHIEKRNREVKKFDLNKIAAATKNFTGSEIEEAINDAMYNAFDADREFTTKDVINAAKATKPLSKIMVEQVAGLRDWADGRARMASAAETKTQRGSPRRKLGPSSN